MGTGQPKGVKYTSPYTISRGTFSEKLVSLTTKKKNVLFEDRVDPSKKKRK